VSRTGIEKKIQAILASNPSLENDQEAMGDLERDTLSGIRGRRNEVF